MSTVRPATAADDNGMWRVLEAVLASGDTFPFSPDSAREDILPAWRGRGSRAYVAEVEGEIAATYMLRPNQPGQGAHVANGGYAVHPDFRRCGLGRAIGEHSIAEARRLGFRALQFNLVVATNEAAIALWRSLSFEVVGTLPGAFRHPERGYVDALVMFRALDDQEARLTG